jgi:hypothetical protein
MLFIIDDFVGVAIYIYFHLVVYIAIQVRKAKSKEKKISTTNGPCKNRISSLYSVFAL